MEAEHCSREGFEDRFFTGNKKRRTWPANEWAITVHGDYTHANLSPGRRLQTICNLMLLGMVRQAKLKRSEVIAVVLFTGPMVSTERFCGRLCNFLKLFTATTSFNFSCSVIPSVFAKYIRRGRVRRSITRVSFPFRTALKILKSLRYFQSFCCLIRCGSLFCIILCYTVGHTRTTSG
jgi:hypothetical protein